MDEEPFNGVEIEFLFHPGCCPDPNNHRRYHETNWDPDLNVHDDILKAYEEKYEEEQ